MWPFDGVREAEPKKGKWTETSSATRETLAAQRPSGGAWVSRKEAKWSSKGHWRRWLCTTLRAARIIPAWARVDWVIKVS